MFPVEAVQRLKFGKLWQSFIEDALFEWPQLPYTRGWGEGLGPIHRNFPHTPHGDHVRKDPAPSLDSHAMAVHLDNTPAALPASFHLKPSWAGLCLLLLLESPLPRGTQAVFRPDIIVSTHTSGHPGPEDTWGGIGPAFPHQPALAQAWFPGLKPRPRDSW